jgi:trigger factor
MNITQEKVTDLNSILKVKLGPEDYQQRVDVQLKELQRKASMPGFRPGKVPVGMVKKMYGKSILAEEVNEISSKKLMEYVKNRLRVYLKVLLPTADSGYVRAHIQFNLHVQSPHN